jgi:quercetin dioxygenase-like cupin family protein
MVQLRNTRFIESHTTTVETVGGGVQRKILGFDEHMMMTHVAFKKGSIGSVHSHPHRQVTYIESGLFLVQIGSEKKELKGGDCFFIPPDIDHGVVALEDGSLVDVFVPARMDFLPQRTDK